ncbi:MAG: adenylate/guanylate cyclase domain-containing protein [Actinomycetota bacterium]
MKEQERASIDGEGPLARDPFVTRGLIRPTSRAMRILLLRIAAALGIAAGIAGVAFRLTSSGVLIHPGIQLLVCITSLVLGAIFLVLSFLDLDWVHRVHAPFAYLVAIAATVLVTLGIYSVGPRTLIGVVLYVEVAIFTFFLLPRVAAIAMVALMAGEFGALLYLQGGYPAPTAQWLFVVIALAAIGATVGGLLGTVVEETTRLSRLRRFLPPQVTDAVLSAGGEELLRPHRRQIAVLFCDLRGYTKFSGSSEPEDVVELLGDYYDVVGALLRTSEATIGNFGGDGIMAYFNDPVPCPDPAGDAVKLALSLRKPMARFIERWTQRGFDIGYGIGITFGYATLGVLGFEGRHDYTAVGSVVNLAARLSDEAGPGVLLLDNRTYDAVRGKVEADPVTVELKGFPEPVTAYRVRPTAVEENATPASEERAGGSDIRATR